ncbi:MAG TPA: Ni/Fe-hydrogenase cytochrome b subunit [Anaeromyxobacteraceae bacterium]|nr:Ni/Fe-hydrogenase cytochrome b subunit [Anaeromyxobacteraceae bacterium]
MRGEVHPRTVGGPLFDRPVIGLLALFAVAAAVIGYRFAHGIGAVSNMNDGFTWGIWEPVNVVVFTGIGAGAYAVGLLCYLLNRGEYHALVRPAVLLGAIAYALGGASVLIALGRYWNLYWLVLPGMWNLSSVLLEVALCVMTYVAVLWIEVLPAVFDRVAQSVSPKRAAWGRRWGARLSRAMPYVIASAMVLPTMHQSSLGGLLLLAGSKVHPLWHTPFLPLLALISCLSMGFGAVVVLTSVLRFTWSARHDQELLASMSKVNGGLLFLFAALRMTDIALRGKLRLFVVPDYHLIFFAVEMILFLVPAGMFFSRRVERNHRLLFRGAVAAVVAGALWRVDAFITCFNPGERWHYHPAFGEVAVTVGMAALGAAVFILVSRLFPVVALEELHLRAKAALTSRPVMLRRAFGSCPGGTPVRRGEYVRLHRVAFTVIHSDGEPLPSGPTTRWVRVPEALFLLAVPVVGALYVLALPVVLLATALHALLGGFLRAARALLSFLTSVLTPPWAAGRAHLSGDAGDDEEPGRPAGGEPDPQLDELARRIASERERRASGR